MNYAELLTLLAPETLLVVTALGLLMADLTNLTGASGKERMRFATWLTTLGCVGAAVAMFLAPVETAPSYLGGLLVLSPLTRLVKLVLLALTVATAFVTLESDFTAHVGEYFVLLLLATVGSLFLVSTDHLLLLFVSLELLSLSLYIMTAFRKHDAQSAEAALKYFLIGGTAAGMLLFGLSLLYGVTGELTLPRIAARLEGAPLDPLLLVALVTLIAGFGFKVAAVPFHLWAPDAYVGAPAPAAAFIASVSKVASFYALARVLTTGVGAAAGSGAWHGFAPGWMPLLALTAAASMVLGNVAAIVQTNVRRLLAYSAIAHAGYMLVGLLGGNAQGLPALIYYVATYAATVVGAFAIVAVVEEKTGRADLGALAGLRQRSPLLAICLLVFLLSLAGIPPLAGFFGKVYLFTAALGNGPTLGALWLVVLALAFSTVSLYYYLQVLKQAFVAAPALDAPPIVPEQSTVVVLVLLALAVVGLGCAPQLFLQWL